MGLSSCYWLYDIQHGDRLDFYALFPIALLPLGSATPNVPQEDTYAFEEFTGATLISSGVFHVIT
ncbi:hypothetical protein N7527_012057 [Penicillium freii]|nr:hypothetical protein N7527_012057 [Penicillium freii]